MSSSPIVEWESATEFSVNGYRFTLDYQHGGSKVRSEDHRFLMMKGLSFLKHYTSLDPSACRRVLELGVYQGGSFVFMDQLLKPEKLSAVELNATPIPALDAYVARSGGRCRVHYGTSQDDTEALSRIVREDFGGALDLVVDDASHWYKQTRTSFETLFPMVRPGGLYIIEDWSWSFQDDFQRPDHDWIAIESPANLVVDLMEEMVRGHLIQDIRIFPDLLIVQRNDTPTGSVFASQARRGRAFQPL